MAPKLSGNACTNRFDTFPDVVANAFHSGAYSILFSTASLAIFFHSPSLAALSAFLIWDQTVVKVPVNFSASIDVRIECPTASLLPKSYSEKLKSRTFAARLWNSSVHSIFSRVFMRSEAMTMQASLSLVKKPIKASQTESSACQSSTHSPGHTNFSCHASSTPFMFAMPQAVAASMFWRNSAKTVVVKVAGKLIGP